jgi:hypothetical protein
MTPTEILSAASRAGVSLHLHGPDIVYRGPRGALSTDLLAAIKAGRVALVLELGRRRLCAEGSLSTSDGSPLALDCDRTCRVIADPQCPPAWLAMVQAQRESILARLNELPPPTVNHGRNLLNRTRAFLGTKHWTRAIASDWPLTELFGICASAPVARIDLQGLIPQVAFSAHANPEIVEIEPALARVHLRSGSVVTFRRGARPLDEMVLWWECESILGSE